MSKFSSPTQHKYRAKLFSTYCVKLAVNLARAGASGYNIRKHPDTPCSLLKEASPLEGPTTRGRSQDGGSQRRQLGDVHSTPRSG